MKLENFHYGLGILGIVLVFASYFFKEDYRVVGQADFKNRTGKEKLIIIALRLFQITGLIGISIPITSLVIYFLIELFQPTLEIIKYIPTWGYIEILLYVVTLVIVILFYSTRKNKIYKPAYRGALNLMYHITPSYIILARVVFLIYNIIYAPYRLNCALFGNYEPSISGLVYIPQELNISICASLSICVGLFIYRLHKRKERFHVIIPSRRYVLFLRSFSDDKNLSIDKDIVEFYKKSKIRVIEVADPTTVTGNENFLGSSYFLPSDNWQKELSYAIMKSQKVICCVGNTEGVQWEMYENSAYLDKYIFYVNKPEEIIKHLEDHERRYRSNEIFTCLSQLLKLSQVESFYFIIHKGRCYYSTEFQPLISPNEEIKSANSFTIDYRTIKSGVPSKYNFDWIDKSVFFIRHVTALIKLKHITYTAGFIAFIAHIILMIKR